MANYYTENYLSHHGVLGMKWGNRKQVYRNRSSTTAKDIYKSKNKVAAKNIGSKFIKRHLSATDSKKIQKKKIIVGLSAAAIVITGTQIATAILATGIPAVTPISIAANMGGSFALKHLEDLATTKLAALK